MASTPMTTGRTNNILPVIFFLNFILEGTTLGITPNQRYGGIYCAIEFVCHLRLWCKYIT